MSTPMWDVEDHTTKRPAGYLRLLKDGKRVCDFFPFAADTEPMFVRQQAEHIARVLNEHEDR